MTALVAFTCRCLSAATFIHGLLNEAITLFGILGITLLGQGKSSEKSKTTTTQQLKWVKHNGIFLPEIEPKFAAIISFMADTWLSTTGFISASLEILELLMLD